MRAKEEDRRDRKGRFYYSGACTRARLPRRLQATIHDICGSTRLICSYYLRCRKDARIRWAAVVSVATSMHDEHVIAYMHRRAGRRNRRSSGPVRLHVQM